MVDWSSGNRCRGGRSDTIWIAHGPRTADGPLTHSPHSRTEAIDLIRSLLEKEIGSNRCVLGSFDFAYGYPVDFAAALHAATGKSDRDLPWLLVWKHLGEHIKDDEGTAPGAKPTNRSNRFEVANQINALLSTDPSSAGPFWCASPEAAYRYIPQNRPPEPFQTAQGYMVKGLWLTDKRAKSGSPFRARLTIRDGDWRFAAKKPFREHYSSLVGLGVPPWKGKLGTKVKERITITSPLVRRPTTAAQESGTMGDKAKPPVFPFCRRLCCLRPRRIPTVCTGRAHFSHKPM